VRALPEVSALPGLVLGGGGMRGAYGRLQADVAPVDSRIAWAASELIDHPSHRIDSLARGLGVSRQYVRRLFLEHTGLSPKAFARVGAKEVTPEGSGLAAIGKCVSPCAQSPRRSSATGGHAEYTIER